MRELLGRVSTPAEPWRERLAVVLVALLFVILRGYQVGVGNQVDQYPPAVSLGNSAASVGDFTLQSIQNFGPRFYLVRLIELADQVLPEQMGIYAIYLAEFVALVAGFYLLARELKLDHGLSILFTGLISLYRLDLPENAGKADPGLLLPAG